MIFHLKSTSVVSNKEAVGLRCPACRQNGSFEYVTEQAILLPNHNPAVILGQRRCPNSDCRAHVFVAWDGSRNVLVSYPPQLIDFDASDVPEKVRASFNEALVCHAHNAYVAAAIMVRRTLEDICADKNATGKTLNDRIGALGSTVILPPGLLKGLDNLRLLGNDAAHVEAKDYEGIGEKEVALALDVTKEVIKAVYQLEGLVARLSALKKPKSN